MNDADRLAKPTPDGLTPEDARPDEDFQDFEQQVFDLQNAGSEERERLQDAALEEWGRKHGFVPVGSEQKPQDGEAPG